MSSKPSVDYFRTKGLSPYQAEFAAAFTEEVAKPYQELVAPVGTGKTRLAGAIIAFGLENTARSRVLVLVPAALLPQWRFELSSRLSSSSLDIRPLLVDRATFLDLQLDAIAGAGMWPSPAIILMSMSLASHKDVAPRLVETEWDLVVIDESHLLTGKLKALFQALKDSQKTRRALLLTGSAPPCFPGDAVTHIELRDIVDWDGHPLVLPSRMELTLIRYHRTEEEQTLVGELSGLAQMIEGTPSFGRFVETTILRATSSSIYAAERSLRRLKDAWKLTRNKIAHGMPLAGEDMRRVHQQLERVIDDLEPISEPDEALNTTLNSVQQSDYLAIYDRLDSLLDRIPEIPYDSKLEALIAYLKEHRAESGSSHICIWTSFAYTAHFVGWNLREVTDDVWLVTGDLDMQERDARISSFRDQGGILVATDVALMNADLGYVSECINYDLPLDAKSLEQRWGRFLRLGRRGRFRMFAFVDETKSFLWEENLLQALQDSV